MKALIFEGSYGRSKVGHVQHSFQGAYLFEVRSSGPMAEDKEKEC